jgi:hypothetical protein
VGTSDEGQAIVVVERLGDILAEGVAGTTGRYTPPTAVVRVRPKKITHRAFVRDFLHAVDGPNMVEGVDGRRETTVETEDLVGLG